MGDTTRCLPVRSAKLALTIAVMMFTFGAGCARHKTAPPTAAETPGARVEAVTPHRAGSASLYPDGQTPGATNPHVTQANIRTTICVVHWTTTIRPPVSYTNALKRQQLVTLGDTVSDPHQHCMLHSANPRCYE